VTVLEALDAVCWALAEHEQDLYFAAVDVFRDAFRDAHRDEAPVDDRAELVRLAEFQRQLETDGDTARAAAVMTIRDWLTIQRQGKAGLN
jgi:hypothetical protein